MPREWGCSSGGWTSDRHAADAGSISQCGKEFCSKSQLSVQTLLWCPYDPVRKDMFYICVHVNDPIAHVRVGWIMETLKHPACTLGWVVRLCQNWLSPGRQPKFPHRKNPIGTIHLFKKKKKKKKKGWSESVLFIRSDTCLNHADCDLEFCRRLTPADSRCLCQNKEEDNVCVRERELQRTLTLKACPLPPGWYPHYADWVTRPLLTCPGCWSKHQSPHGWSLCKRCHS